jgi:hypothetical protein
MQSNQDHAVYSEFLAQNESARLKATMLYVHTLSLCRIACLLQQRATRKLCKVLPTKEDHRLDHATKLEACLPRLLPSHCA